MTCGDSSYYPMNYYPGFYPASMMRDAVAHNNLAAAPRRLCLLDPRMPPQWSRWGLAQQLPAGTMEESFIENILRFNKGKIGTFYFTYQGNNKWNAMVYHGRVETAGRDHIIISDPSSGKRYLLMMANLDWVEFEEKINYPCPKISPDVQASLTTSD